MKIPQKNSKNIKIRILLVLIMVLTCLTGFAQDDKENKDDRIINKVPRHLPIKVDITFGDDKSTLAGTKIKITNIGEKPVYFLDLFLISTGDFPIVNKSGTQLGFPTILVCGSSRLGDFGEIAEEKDIPIKKGESCNFEISEKDMSLFKRFLSEHNIFEVPKLDLIFQILSFGDKTGFVGTTGAQQPQPVRPFKRAFLYNRSKEFNFF